MNVHLVWHVRHARNLDGSPTEHRDPERRLHQVQRDVAPLAAALDTVIDHVEALAARSTDA